MDEEKLIECVSKYEFLYNIQHPKYTDALKKIKAWKKISEQLNQPVAACKKKWQDLRNAYRRAYNKKKGKSGKAAKKKWKYEDEMSFVASFLIQRNSFESIGLISDDEELSNNDEAIEAQNPNFNNGMNSTDAVDVADDAEYTMDIEIKNEDETIVCNKSAQPQYNRTKKAKTMKMANVLPVQSASAVLMDRLLGDQNQLPHRREPDELDRFFLNISETVKKFSPYLQVVAKNKIFSLVSEMELQQLAPPPSFTTSSQYAYTPSPASSSSSVQPRATCIPTSPENWNTSTDDQFKIEFE